MKKILNVEVKSTEFGNYPEKVRIELSKDKVAEIRNAISVMQQNKFIKSIRLSACGEYLTNSRQPFDDFVTDVEEFIVYPQGGIYFYGQEKHDSSMYIETTSFRLPDVKNVAVKHNIISLESLCDVWTAMYGENFKTEYSGAYKKLKKLKDSLHHQTIDVIIDALSQYESGDFTVNDSLIEFIEKTAKDFNS